MSEYLSVADRSLFIGDNLDALRGIEPSSVDLIYLDPPGNTGRTYSASQHAKAHGVTFDDVWTLAKRRRGVAGRRLGRITLTCSVRSWPHPATTRCWHISRTWPSDW